MTTNQIAFLEYQEKKRSNQAQEGLTRSRDSETARSNLANESIKLKTLDETSRANLAKEQLQRESNAETQRSNLRREKTELSKLNEQARYNTLSLRERAKDRELERQKANLSALLQRESNAIAQERNREQARSNLANEQLVSERNFITMQQNELRRRELGETARRNTLNYQVDMANVNEQVRHNTAQEAWNRELGRYDAETRRFTAERNADIAEREHMLNVYKTPGAIVNDATRSIGDVVRAVIPFGR